jgi:ferredoxin-type protein NapG
MPADPSDPLDRRVNRRSFFREGFRELLKPIVRAAEPLEQVIRQMDTAQAAVENVRRVPLSIWLRPPGALPENKFRETCSRCSACVNVCPAQCIKLDATGAKGNGVPYIDADAMACVVCEGLQCMHACPSGALVPTALADIDMGTAVWHQETCLRSNKEDCTICIDKCPLGAVAIELKGNQVQVNPHGCIGCGVCQHDCPTSPKSIRVYPIAMRTQA